MRVFLLTVIFILGAGGQVAHAERSLTLDEALALAQQRNHDLVAARARVKQAEAGIALARAALLPQLAGQFRYTRNSFESVLDLRQQNAALFGLADTISATSGNPIQNAAIEQFKAEVQARTPSNPIVIQPLNQVDGSISLNIPLVVPWAYFSVKAARLTRDAAQSTFGTSEAAMLATTAQAFFAAAGTEELATARQHAVEVAERTHSDAKTRFEAGTLSRVDVMRAELALVRARQALIDAQDMRSMAYRSLATLIQERGSFRVVLAGEGTSSLADAPLDQLTAQAATQRPELVALMRSISATRAQAMSSRLRWLPNLGAFGSFRAFNYGGFTGRNYLWSVGVQLDWVFYDGGARYAQRRTAEAQAEESEARLRQLRDNVADEVANSQATLKSRRINLDTAKRSVTLAEETLRLVRAQYEAGTVTQLDLLQAQDALVGAEVAHAQARFDLAFADLTLQRVIGEFPKSTKRDRP